jgi:hypothetical protein
MLYRSYDELVDEDAKLKQGQAERRQQSDAAVVDQHIRFENENGGSWDTKSTTKRPPAKRSPITRHEVKELQTLFNGKGSEVDG